MTIIAYLGKMHIEFHQPTLSTAANAGVHVSGTINLDKDGAFVGAMVSFETLEATCEFVRAANVRAGGGGFISYGDHLTSFRTSLYQTDATARGVGMMVILFIRD